MATNSPQCPARDITALPWQTRPVAATLEPQQKPPPFNSSELIDGGMSCPRYVSDISMSTTPFASPTQVMRVLVASNSQQCLARRDNPAQTYGCVAPTQCVKDVSLRGATIGADVGADRVRRPLYFG